MEKSTNNYLKKYHFAEHFNATYDHIEDGLVLDGDFCAADPSLWAPLSSILLPEDFLRIMKSIYRAKASKNIQELMEALDVESPRVLAHSCGFSECIFQKLTNDTLLLIRMLQRKACFSDEDRRFKVVCPFLLRGFKRLFDFERIVRQSRSG